MSSRTLKTGLLPWCLPVLLAFAGWRTVIRQPLGAWARGHAEQLQGRGGALAEIRGRRDAQKLHNAEALSKLGTLVPSLQSPMLVVERIVQAARSHGLSSLTYEVKESIAHGHALAVPLSIRLRGKFGDAASFLRNLEESPLRPILRRVELKRAEGQNAVTLTVDALIACSRGPKQASPVSTTSSYGAEN